MSAKHTQQLIADLAALALDDAESPPPGSPRAAVIESIQRLAKEHGRDPAGAVQATESATLAQMIRGSRMTSTAVALSSQDLKLCELLGIDKALFLAEKVRTA